MYNPDTDPLFPARVIPRLRDLRGEEWKTLVDKVAAEEHEALDKLGFILMLTQLCNCMGCRSGSYRAWRGCTQCAQQTISRYRGSDADLTREFKKARKDCQHLLNEHPEESSGKPKE